jgi:Mce-associated membrane protein
VTTSQREKAQESASHNNGTETGNEVSAVLVDTETPTPDAVNADDASNAADNGSGTADAPRPRRRVSWSRVLALGVLPALALGLAVAAGFLKFQGSSSHADDIASIESVQAAKDSTTAMLSYKPDSVEQQLGAAKALLTGTFRDSYTSLTKDVVIPGAKQKQISAAASVPAAALVSATPHHAVVLEFVNQRVTVGTDAPTDTASCVRVTLDKTGDRWLISDFQPV